ncbi:unnamed protein product [marine sediment metagenome]|uniref:Uncharacterized protein n=1 Tax=marine sediment metagenome TaxID=412755 RepID=X1RAF5_9ZZZZ
MAKSDSFFIRHTTNIDNSNLYNQTAIDLGAYVDALGKSVLRIHNIAVAFTDKFGRSADLITGGTIAAAAQFQLVTQTQADIVVASNKSVIASGMINAYRTKTGAGVADSVSHDFDNLPQLWTNGYLVAVDSIFLGGAATDKWNEDVYVTVTMECTVETMSQAAAMALALSQQ